MSGARAAAMEEAARTGEVPATVAAEAGARSRRWTALAHGRRRARSAESPANGVAVWSGGTPQPVGAAHTDDEGPEIDTAPLVADAPGVVGTATRADGQGLSTVVVTVADPPVARRRARSPTARVGTRSRSQSRHVPGRRGGGRVPAARGAGRVGPGAATRHDVMLSGHVRCARHRPARRCEVAGAAVTLIDAQGDVAAVGVTDGVGCYRLVGVPDGAYTVTAASAGHQPPR